jgi:hypothetical protein
MTEFTELTGMLKAGNAERLRCTKNGCIERRSLRKKGDGMTMSLQKSEQDGMQKLYCEGKTNGFAERLSR